MVYTVYLGFRGLGVWGLVFGVEGAASHALPTRFGSTAAQVLLYRPLPDKNKQIMSQIRLFLRIVPIPLKPKPHSLHGCSWEQLTKVKPVRLDVWCLRDRSAVKMGTFIGDNVTMQCRRYYGGLLPL